MDATTPNDPEFPQLWELDNTGQTGGTPDDYTIAEVQQEGGTQTAPEDGTHAIALEPGTDVSDVNFGNKAMPGSISGHKWHDLNEDGSKDDDEPGLEGWTIDLDENNNSQFDPEEPSTCRNPTATTAPTPPNR